MTTPHDTASVALSYVTRGWAVVPLHDVTGGTCSCGSANPAHDHEQGGKHPISRGWQNAGLTTPAAVADAWTRRPGANVGIVTGRASGMWVLDIDPKNGGDVQLAGLVSAFGLLPETYTVTTGSGGSHYYWLMPEFDFTTSRGRLPVGLDVRGNAGQVVAPPSYTLKGPYRVALDAPVVAAPGWLLGFIRPEERVEVGPAGVDFDAGAWGRPAGGELDRARGSAYAARAVAELLATLATAPPGTRNDTAYRVARRLSELVNSPWSGLSTDHIWQGFMAACAACDVDGGFSQSEAFETLRKAVHHQGGQGTDLPPATHHGTTMPWVASDFDQAGQVPGTQGVGSGAAGQGMQTLTDVAGPMINGPIEQGIGGVGAGVNPFASPGDVVASVVDPVFELAVRTELGRLIVRDEATRRMAARSVVATDFGAEALDDAGLAALPAVAALVDGWLDRDSLARVNGPSGHGKSFVMVDLGGCVQNGIPWHGYPVARANVCYVIAEGVSGMNVRAQAWATRHSLPGTGITWVTRAVQVGGPEWGAFVAWCAARDFGLIIVDTQARNTVGVNENDATEMGEVIAGLDALRTATGACVSLVHHRGLAGEHGRGSTAVKGALSTELDVSRNGLTITVKSTKQKDRADPVPLLLTMNSVGASVVLVSDRESLPEDGPFQSPRMVISVRNRAALALADVLMVAKGSGLTKAEALNHALIQMDMGKADTVRRTIRRAWSDLIDLGRIAKAASREAHFFIELDGAPVMDANPRKLVQGGPELYLP